LEDAWSQAASGRRVLVLLGGEPGIGKTTLAARLAVSAHASGGLVLHGRWDDARVSNQAFVECFEEYSRARPKTVLDAGLDRHARQISQTIQAAGERTGAADIERSGSAEAERSRLFEAVDGLLRAMASRRPVLVVLDDLQGADRSSLLLLRRLMSVARATPLLVVATYRNTELGRGGVSSFLPALTRCAGCRQMVVGGLSAEESAELVARVTGVKLAAPAPGLTRQLHQETAGNPSRLIEMVRRRHDADTLPAAGPSRSSSGRPAVPAAGPSRSSSGRPAVPPA
jgi:predicted ATPase